MRAVLLVAVAVIAIAAAACKKSAASTAPIVTDTFSIAGTWTGCVVESGTTCTAVSMTLSDSSLTDSTAAVKGSGNWGENVSIAGKLTDQNISLTATAPGVIQKWTLVGLESGNAISGLMTVPDGVSSFTASFTRSP